MTSLRPVLASVAVGLELAWPPGFSVRFTPRLEVLNARGDVVAFDGSQAGSACGTGDENAMYVDFWR